jgi:hypothetical protein
MVLGRRRRTLCVREGPAQGCLLGSAAARWVLGLKNEPKGRGCRVF